MIIVDIGLKPDKAQSHQTSDLRASIGLIVLYEL
jgi:hypothetical protein